MAGTDSPALDPAISRLSNAANYSRLWLPVSGLLAVVGGDDGRRAAADGLTSIAVTATIVNAALKPLGRRRRPDRGPALPRRVRLPRSRSFPSVHAASGVALATGVAATQPRIALPLGVLAATVAYSRVHTSVHYPADVVMGAVLGVVLAQMTPRVRGRRSACAPSATQP